VMNTAATPVLPPTPLVIEMPPGAEDTTVLDGSSPQAAVKGPQVTISGPFPPGRTIVQMAYRLPVSGPRLDISQSFPAPLDAVALMVQKVGDVGVDSTQLTNQREVPAEGRTFIAAMGPRLAAGTPLAMELKGLPHRSTVPKMAALVAALLILALGAWGAFRRGDSASAARRELGQRLEHIFADMIRLEVQARAGQLDATRYQARRSDLMGELERIYGELDTPAAGRDDEGLPA
jgi:hypothetical protein